MKYFISSILVTCILSALCNNTAAFGAAVVPDVMIIEEGGQGTFRIMNPNGFQARYHIKSEDIDCSPETGVLDAESSTMITCRQLSVKEATTILVYLSDNEGDQDIGIMPAIAVKAIPSNNKSDVNKQSHHTPLVIQRENSTQETQIAEAAGTETPKTRKQTVRQTLSKYGETGTVIILTTAIIILLAVPRKHQHNNKETRNKDNTIKKKALGSPEQEPKSAFDTSLHRLSQGDQPSASAEASHDPPLSAPWHDGQVQNQQP